ncbi:MAG TPA: outer membrane lipoprotein carrier protein LolA [Gemmatimonadaceae bacterium]|nr:outer membrane lipoprotein carrier protein LolA [Gemmatimonadaceae bacterium]
MRVGSTLVWVAIISAAPLRAQQSVVQHAERVYTNIKTLRATFTQTVTNPLTGSDVTSHGELQQRIPGDVSVRFTDPAGDRIVANGKVVWVYLPSTNPGQVIRTNLDSSGVQVPDVATWFLHSPETRYTMTNAGSATVDGHATTAVTLVPKDPSLPFTKATIWVDDDDALIRQVETVDQQGLKRRIMLTRLTPNAALDKGAFEFKVPKGVKVFGGSEG